MATRDPVVAGQFYPASETALREAVEGYAADSKVQAAPERVAALVAPHAGYMYSGPTAGYAFARVRGKKPKRVILLGRSHRQYFDRASVYESGEWNTPLGAMPVDEAFARALAAVIGPNTSRPHQWEHSLEVQLPFLRVVLGEIPIVPVLFGSDAVEWHMQLGETLADMADASDLVVASTDLSHYLSESAANAIDKMTLDRVLSQDYEALAKELVSETCSMCGGSAVVVAMAYALACGAKDWQLLDYRTSAYASGNTSEVVGYGAVSMEWANGDK